MAHPEVLSHQPMRIIATFIQNKYNAAYRQYEMWLQISHDDIIATAPLYMSLNTNPLTVFG